MAILLITHDLGVVAETAHRVAVMYAGKVVEYSDVRALFGDPRHPYTIGLMESIPRMTERRERLHVIPGTVPSPAAFPPGCAFHPRCPVRPGPLPGGGARAGERDPRPRRALPSLARGPRVARAGGELRMIAILLAVLVASTLLAVPFWKSARREARDEGIPVPVVLGALLLFGLAGAYAFSVGKDARARELRGALAWGLVAGVVALSAAVFVLAGVPVLGSLGLGATLWLGFHLFYTVRRPRLTVQGVIDRAAKRGRLDAGGEKELLVVEGLVKHFPIRRGLMNRATGAVRAVDGVDLVVRDGETLGLVGESGCGKTTTGRMILRLMEPTAGSIRYRGVDLARLTTSELRAMRKEIQIIFQDPYSSLNPRMTVEGMLKEALAIHGLARGRDADRRVGELLEMVGLSPFHARRYPHEFSGDSASGSGSRERWRWSRGSSSATSR